MSKTVSDSGTLYAARNITFSSGDGRFTVSNAGIYIISIQFGLNVVTSSNNDHVIKVNGAATYDHNFRVHSGVDPAIHTVTLIKSLSANDYVTFHVENTTSTNTTTAQDGTTATIWRIQ